MGQATSHQRRITRGHNSIKQEGEAFKPLSRLPQQAVQSNMVYLAREALMVSFFIAARTINADR